MKHTALDDKKRHDDLTKKATDATGTYSSNLLTAEERRGLGEIFDRNLARAANGNYNF